MKKAKSICIIFFLLFFGRSQAQEHEIAELLLNYAKYVSILETVDEVRETYDILSKWYGNIKDVAEGDLELHTVFLNELKAVNPAVANYYKVASILEKQTTIVNHYSDFFNYINQTQNFNAAEIDYLKNIFDNLLEESADYLEQLFMAITATEMNMSDDERLKIIDKLDTSIGEQLIFLQGLNERIVRISAFKDKENQNISEYDNYNLKDNN